MFGISTLKELQKLFIFLNSTLNPNIDSVIILNFLKKLMSRWDDKNLGYNYDRTLDDEQEAHLLKKLQDYQELEKKEIVKRRFFEASNQRKPGSWTNRFILASIIQAAIIASMTIFLVTVQLMHSEINVMQLLSSSFDGPSKWFFFGYIMYMTLVVAVALTAVFYYQLEANMKKEFRGFKNILAGIHLFGMNVGGTLATIFLMWFGLDGSGISNLVLSGVTEIESKVENIEQFTNIIGVFATIFAVGILAGGIAFLTTYFQKNPNFINQKPSSFEFRNNFTEFDRL